MYSELASCYIRYLIAIEQIMIVGYGVKTFFKPQHISLEQQYDLDDFIWIDLVSPTKEEERWIEKNTALEIPSQEEMREIELSSRLYTENNALYMTATMVAQSQSIDPQYDAITFVLANTHLITIRYIEPHAFRFTANNLQKLPANTNSALLILLNLLEAAVDRLADSLEYIGHHLDGYSVTILQSDNPSVKPDYQLVMQNIGHKSNLNTKARESLMTFTRLVIFFTQNAKNKFDDSSHQRLHTIIADVNSLSDYANFISNKISFLLDATLGMINIEQSNIIKIFSVAAVIFLPPTLIASIYGMNFTFMPELSQHWGYPSAIVLMLFSAWLPYKYFKYRKWL